MRALQALQRDYTGRPSPITDVPKPINKMTGRLTTDATGPPLTAFVSVEARVGADAVLPEAAGGRCSTLTDSTAGGVACAGGAVRAGAGRCTVEELKYAGRAGCELVWG